MTASESILVLGIGNVLWADEGFGVRCAEVLAQRYAFSRAVEIVDGGTLGLYLLPLVQEADKLLILDAVDYGLAPGTLCCVEGEAVPRFLGAKKLSLHQTGFQEVLALAELTGRTPREIALIGCQPEVLDDFGGSLRPLLRAGLEQAVTLAAERLSAWGASPVLRETPAADGGALDLGRYEGERPSAEAACRRGDVRFLAPRRTAEEA